MNIHKFGNGNKNGYHKIVQPKTIFWKPVEVKYPAKKINYVSWDIFVLISLSYNLKLNQISITNEVTLEEVDDMVTTITNNSDKLKKIQENTFLCRLYYSI